MVSCWHNWVRPGLVAATQTDSFVFIRKAIADSLEWERPIGLLGLEDEPRLERLIRERHSLWVKILQHAEDVAFERCADEHDFSMITKMGEIERQAELLGFTVNAYNDAKRCRQVRIDFDSLITENTVTSGDGWSGSAIYHVKGSVQVDVESGKSPELGRLSWVEFNAHWQRTITVGGGKSCTLHDDSVSAAPGQIGVSKLSVELVAPPAWKAKEVTLSAGGPGIVETYNTSPRNCFSGPSTFTGQRWLFAFFNLHQSDRAPGGYLFKPFQPGNGAVLGRRTSTGTFTSPGFYINETSTWKETLTIDVVHAPEK
jgi:hypothetical protein